MSPQLFWSGSYIYMNSFILAFGVWAIIAPESVDAILMVSDDLKSMFDIIAHRSPIIVTMSIVITVVIVHVLRDVSGKIIHPF